MQVYRIHRCMGLLLGQLLYFPLLITCLLTFHLTAHLMTQINIIHTIYTHIDIVQYCNEMITNVIYLITNLNFTLIV